MSVENWGDKLTHVIRSKYSKNIIDGLYVLVNHFHAWHDDQIPTSEWKVRILSRFDIIKGIKTNQDLMIWHMGQAPLDLSPIFNSNNKYYLFFNIYNRRNLINQYNFADITKRNDIII
jgi:hypothetical protein